MIDKQKLLTTIKGLPEHINLDDLLDRIMLLEKIDIGLNQVNSGQTMTTIQAKEKLKKWLK
jgi:hypothetical protein